ncbi:hypothetical protein ASZ78_007498 [Callipepla squamata]|uniref:SAB domain-containing protein n=1 Tax=Callipepla squamata TaxID=9009 RepID=A0A226NG84_CALSU|nr:hypothetical protein ASZ78_007498 [Callipepla squamata]
MHKYGFYLILRTPDQILADQLAICTKLYWPLVNAIALVASCKHLVHLNTDSEQTDTAADGETTATENSLIKRIQGENVYVKHSNLMLEDLDKTQEDLMKHQTNISELKRTFLETSTETAVSNEWEKRLSTSPVRLAARQEEAPMIEPLVPEEVSEI